MIQHLTVKNRRAVFIFVQLIYNFTKGTQRHPNLVGFVYLFSKYFSPNPSLHFQIPIKFQLNFCKNKKGTLFFYFFLLKSKNKMIFFIRFHHITSF